MQIDVIEMRLRKSIVRGKRVGFRATLGQVVGNCGLVGDFRSLTCWLSQHLQKLPLIVILAGILFSLYLHSLIPDEVFYSGDAGLKTLLSKQFCAGDLCLDLRVPADPWVQDLWERGLYPFGPPFVYDIFNRHYLAFPFVFPLLSAPFYAFFGFRGLYVIPLVSTWLLWFAFLLACRRMGLGSTSTSFALAALIFSSPLSMYSAMYWEHTLAVLLAFGGMAIALAPPSRAAARGWVILGGVVAGLSVWLRPELVCLAGITVVMLYASFKLRSVLEERAAFVISLLATIVLFWGFNMVVYHHPLGAHSFQVLEGFWLHRRVARSFRIFESLSVDLFSYFPIAFFPVAGILLSLWSKRVGLTASTKILFWTCALFIPLAALMLPNDGGKQWGPRYLLILMPIISLLAALMLDATLKSSKAGWRYAGSALFLLPLILGAYRNTYFGTVSLRDDYRERVLPALNLVQQHDSKVVAVAHQWIGQELEAAFEQKTFFRVREREDLVTLGTALLDQGYQNFLYLTLTYQERPDDLQFRLGDRLFDIEFSELGQHGSYLIYGAAIGESQATGERGEGVCCSYPSAAQVLPATNCVGADISACWRSAYGQERIS